jgi:inosine/xanthosine triphosphate pyrophosphatase family protein
MLYFVTGNDKKWSEIEAVLSGSGIEIERSNIDCKNTGNQYNFHYV